MDKDWRMTGKSHGLWEEEKTFKFPDTDTNAGRLDLCIEAALDRASRKTSEEE